MIEQSVTQEEIIDSNETVENNLLIELKKTIDSKLEAAILCEAQENNPNYLSIIYANSKFYENFAISEFNLIGKSYDFLFSDIDLDYSSDEDLEYVRLIKAVKDSHPCSIVIDLSDHREQSSKARFKVTFDPAKYLGGEFSYPIFTFEKMEKVQQAENKDAGRSNFTLLKNLERTLRKERLLREIGYLIISDLSIRDIAQSISKALCEYLKADRCLIHDYQEGRTNFLIEYVNNYTKPIFKGSADAAGLRALTNYINFQNHFYEKHGEKDKKSFLTIVNDILSDQNFLSISDICEEYLIASQVAVTTTFNGKVNGGIYIHQSSQRVWLHDEVELIEMVADQFSIAVDRSSSIEKVMVANHALMEKTTQLKEALKEEQKIRKMQSEFVSLVSHEFKTPLQIIDSSRELLVRKLKNQNVVDESIDKSLDRIKNGIQRMSGLIHSTLNLAKMENGDSSIKLERQVFDFKKFILDIIEKNSNLATNKNIKIVTKISELPSDFNGDSKLLDHSFTNIISNAIKYSKENTVVKILAKANDNKIAIRVIDQGMGIPKEDLSSVGTKFFRAKNTLSVAGTGIGLYLTKHFVELHDGNVLIESEVDVGTSVTVTLPRVKITT